jgi:RNA polymerase sigma-70 factor (ECF subfamily)
MDKAQELELVKKAQGGDRDALSELWDEITPKLFGYLINVTRDKVLAEDLLQSTWLKAMQALPQYQLRGIGISSWLFAIARNECRQNWRKNKEEIGIDPVDHDQADKKTDTLQNEMLIDQLLSSLAPDDKELLRLRYIAGLDLKEIAKLLNINAIAARVRMHRAIARAREQAKF